MKAWPLAPGALLFVLLAGCGAASRPHGQSDWERQNINKLQEWKEDLATPPAYPRKDTLLEFHFGTAGEFRFFIDGATLELGKDGVVRFVLVARSPSGVENVTYEGIRCLSAEVRRYAVGRADGSWGGRPGEWRAIESGGPQRWHRALQREYFCPLNEPIRDAAEGVRALRDGGHPLARGMGTDSLRDWR